jgi:hypothetical protein
MTTYQLQILKETIAVVELTGRKTVSVTDIIFVLNRVRAILSILLRMDADLYISKAVRFMASIRCSLAPAERARDGGLYDTYDVNNQAFVLTAAPVRRGGCILFVQYSTNVSVGSAWN